MLIHIQLMVYNFPQDLFWQSCSFTSYSSFCISAFDFSLLSILFCTCLCWILYYWFQVFQFIKTILNSYPVLWVLTAPASLVPCSDFMSTRPISSCRLSWKTFHRLTFKTHLTGNTLHTESGTWLLFREGFSTSPLSISKHYYLDHIFQSSNKNIVETVNERALKPQYHICTLVWPITLWRKGIDQSEIVFIKISYLFPNILFSSKRTLQADTLKVCVQMSWL